MWFLSAGPGESCTACYWVVNINLNLLSWHVVTFWWIFRMTFLKIKFSKKFVKAVHPKMKFSEFNPFIYYLQWNGVYILCISSIDSKFTSISLFHHEWSTRDLLTLKNFLFAACLLCLDHILVSLTSENFDWTELKKVWPINSRTKIWFERF